MEERSPTAMVAYALEMAPELLPFAPELLADLDALGADVPLILSAVRQLKLPSSATVVDLGSGKGAVALAIAEELGLMVHGIELFEPFVHISREAAEKAGLNARCRFTHGEVSSLAGTLPPADVAIFAAMGDVLGPLDVTVGILRQFVAPGGHIIIDDSCRRDGSTASFPGFEHCVTLTETRRLLTAHGDELVAELLEAGDEHSTQDEMTHIADRAAALAGRHPEAASHLAAFVQEQRAEYDFLEDHTIGAVWVLRRC